MAQSHPGCADPDLFLRALTAPGVVGAYPGEKWRNGRRTGDPALVVLVEHKLAASDVPEEQHLAALLGPHPIDVQQASPLQVLFSQPHRYGLSPGDLALLEDRFGFPFPSATQLFATSVLAKRQPFHGNYQPPAGATLGPLAGQMTIRCHASPDAGWDQLRAFLSRIQSELVVGMYDFTAPHIGDALLADLPPSPRALRIAIDQNEAAVRGVKQNDRSDHEQIALLVKALKGRVDQAWVVPGNGHTFPYAYHIKLAVRDGEEFWLSSGNWQSSNQPPLDPLGADAGNNQIDRYDRDWHVIATHPQLAEIWKTYLLWDIEVARNSDFGRSSKSIQSIEMFLPVTAFHYRSFFPPSELQVDAANVSALLTPDNYLEAATELVESAEHSLLVQNQSLTFLQDEENQDERYTRFTAALASKSKTLADFRMIIRDPREFAGANLPSQIQIYDDKGFDTSRIRFQVGLHNKAIIADDAKIMLGSHNFTNAGTTENRDASLIFDDAAVTAYFKPIFEHDWDGLAQQLVIPEPVLAAPSDFPPAGMIRASLASLL